MSLNSYRVSTDQGKYWDIACENEHEALKQIKGQLDLKMFEGQAFTVGKIGEV